MIHSHHQSKMNTIIYRFSNHAENLSYTVLRNLQEADTLHLPLGFLTGDCPVTQGFISDEVSMTVHNNHYSLTQFISYKLSFIARDFLCAKLGASLHVHEGTLTTGLILFQSQRRLCSGLYTHHLVLRREQWQLRQSGLFCACRAR